MKRKIIDVLTSRTAVWIAWFASLAMLIGDAIEHRYPWVVLMAAALFFNTCTLSDNAETKGVKHANKLLKRYQ